MLKRDFFRSVLLFLVLICCFGTLRAEPSDPATELDVAMAKLEKQPYRKRDRMTGKIAAAAAQAPIVTEVNGDRRHLVYEMEIPKVGNLRQEQITVGNRSAVKTVAPGLQKMLSDAKKSATAASARALFQQILSIATAVQTGGLSTLQLVQQAASAGLNIKSAAQARSALGEAEKMFGDWQLVPRDADEDEDVAMPATPEGMPSGAAGSMPGMFSVTKEVTSGGENFRYTRKTNMPGMEGFYSVITVNARTGLPVSEETFVRGERMMMTEYFDVGSDIQIEVPECLRAKP